MYKKYIIEAIGTATILTAKLLTEASPVVMGLVYFSVFWMTRDITTGYFSPLGVLAIYSLDRTTAQDAIYNLASQLVGAIGAIVLFKPLKAYID